MGQLLLLIQNRYFGHPHIGWSLPFLVSFKAEVSD
jgi:hypothetical protein